MMRVPICIFALFISSIRAELEYDSRLQIRLEHVLSDALNADYQFRGEINLKSLHSGAVGLDQIQLTAEELSQLKTLARRNENYRLKTTVKASDGKQTTFYTFTSACGLLESGLQDTLYIHLDHVGNVVGTTLTTQTSCSGSGNFPKTSGEFLTSVYVVHMEMGPIPDTASYIQKLEREREAKDRGETKDNRSFLAKNWMYIVPVVIIVLLASASNPEAGGGQ